MPVAVAVLAAGAPAIGVGAAAIAYLDLRKELKRKTRLLEESEERGRKYSSDLMKTTKEKRAILIAQKAETKSRYKKARRRVLEVSKQLDAEEKEIRKFKVEREDETTKVIVTLGMTGCGKSTLCNRLKGDSSRRGDGSSLPEEDQCRTSGRGGSCTREPQKISVEIGDDKISVVDTPGFNDSSGKDRKLMNALCKYLRGCGGINAFVLVRNGANVRFDGAFQSMLRQYHDVFGDEFFKRLIIVVTRIEAFAREQYVEDEREDVLRDDVSRFFLNSNEGQEVAIPVIPLGFDSYEEAIFAVAGTVPSDKQQFDDIESPYDDLQAEFERAVEDEWNIEQKLGRLTREIKEMKTKRTDV